MILVGYAAGDCEMGVDLKQRYYVATDQHLIDTGEWSAFDESQKEGTLIDFMQPLVDDFSDAVKDGILGEDGQWHITRTPIHAV